MPVYGNRWHRCLPRDRGAAVRRLRDGPADPDRDGYRNRNVALRADLAAGDAWRSMRRRCNRAATTLDADPAWGPPDNSRVQQVVGGSIRYRPRDSLGLALSAGRNRDDSDNYLGDALRQPLHRHPRQRQPAGRHRPGRGPGAHRRLRLQRDRAEVEDPFSPFAAARGNARCSRSTRFAHRRRPRTGPATQPAPRRQRPARRQDHRRDRLGPRLRRRLAGHREPRHRVQGAELKRAPYPTTATRRCDRKPAQHRNRAAPPARRHRMAAAGLLRDADRRPDHLRHRDLRRQQHRAGRGSAGSS